MATVGSFPGMIVTGSNRGDQVQVNTHRAALAVAGLWTFAAIPISEYLYYEGLLMRGFALAAIASPAWACFVWRWLTDGAILPTWVLVGAVAVGSCTSLWLSSEYYYTDYAHLPITLSLVFGLVTWLEQKAGVQKQASGPVTAARE